MPRNPITGKAALLPRIMWADCDPTYPRSVQVSTYGTKADQRGNRPDLKPHRVAVIALDGRSLNDFIIEASNVWLSRNAK